MLDPHPCLNTLNPGLNGLAPWNLYLSPVTGSVFFFYLTPHSVESALFSHSQDLDPFFLKNQLILDPYNPF